MLPDVPYFVPDFAVGNWVMPLHFGQDAPRTVLPQRTTSTHDDAIVGTQHHCRP